MILYTHHDNGSREHSKYSANAQASNTDEKHHRGIFSGHFDKLFSQYTLTERVTETNLLWKKNK